MRNFAKKLTVVEYERIERIRKEISKGRPSNSTLSEDQRFAIWERYDQSIRSVLGRYGAVGSRDGVMFYHGGDWFSEWYDGFALQNPTALVILTDPVSSDLERVVSAHHDQALLGFSGDLDTSFLGLEVLITSHGSFVTWSDCTIRQCQTHLQRLGFRML